MDSRPRAVALVVVLLCMAGVPPLAAGDGIGIAHDLSPDHPPGSGFMGIRLLGTLNLESVSVGGQHLLHSLSALAYDEDADLLYALSDRGVLFHLRLEFEDGFLIQAHPVSAHPLLDAGGRRLRGYLVDAEGMALQNARNGIADDTQVLVSFELRPRIVRFDVRGTPTGAVALPGALRERRAYSNGNKGLEAIALHPVHGVLVGAEQPMRNAPQDEIRIHAVQRGIVWSYPRPVEPNHGLVALEAMPDGRILSLERAHGFLYVPFISILREFPDPGTESARLGEGRIVARLSTGHGFVLDNFEGLTRHRGERFLMVSDDNAKPFQASLLSYFEIVPADDSPPTSDTEAQQGTR